MSLILYTNKTHKIVAKNQLSIYLTYLNPSETRGFKFVNMPSTTALIKN